LGGEFALIERIAGLLPTCRADLLVGIGDDAAVLKSGKKQRRLVVTTDMLFEDVHFRLSWMDPYHLGWKAVAVNLSDVAAMGAKPTFTFVSIALAGDTPVAFVDELYRGMRDVCARHGTLIAGGDTNVSPQRLVINVTQMGVVGKKRLALRSCARPGDVLIVTGSLGDAAAGLVLLEAHGREGAETIAPEAVAAQLQPRPRVREARAAVRTGGVTAMMDLSDGLTGDLRKLCRASGMGARVAVENVPVGEGARRAAVACNADAALWALHGGEDYELLIAAAPRRAHAVCAAIAQTGTPAVIIGEITQGREIVLRRENGTQEAVRQGWDHFAGPSPA
jgi:thiamine-monophosphate kinase